MNENKILNLNEVPFDFVLELRNAVQDKSEKQALEYLKEKCDKKNRKYLRSFFRKVILEGEHPKDWCKFNCAVLVPSVDVMLVNNIEYWRNLYPSKDGYIKINLTEELLGSESGLFGAIAVLDESLSYLTPRVENTFYYYEKNPEVINDLTGTLIQYIARRFSMCIPKDKTDVLIRGDVEEILTVAFPRIDVSSLSGLGERAIRLLCD